MLRGVHQAFSIPFQSLENMAKKEYDVLIVGSGAGGGAVLWRLCEKWNDRQMKIGLIEAGDLLLPSHIYNISPFKSKWKHHFDQIAHPIGQRLPPFSGANQVFALGGKTLFWAGVSPRLYPSEYGNWPLSEQELEPYYRIAEKIMKVHPPSSSPSSPSLPVCPLPLAASHGQTFSSIRFLEKAWGQRTYDLAIHARALQLLMEQGKPVGLKVADGNRNIHRIQAKTIVLAAGTLETPRLLLYSGIPGTSIGRYLANHSFIRASGKWNEDTHPFKKSFLLPQASNDPYQFQIYANRKSIEAVGFGRVESNVHNQLTLEQQRIDKFGVPHIRIDFSYSNKDKEVISQMKRGLEQVFQTLGASFPRIRLMEPGSDYHEFGTCRMGNDPAASATDRNGQIHGIPGLYAADNSIFPSLGAANPVLTLTALAIRIADHITSDFKQRNGNGNEPTS